MAPQRLCIYPSKDSTEAMKAISNGYDFKCVSNFYKIPKSVMRFRLRNKYERVSYGGLVPIFSEQEENSIVKWINDSSSKGFPIQKNAMKQCAQIILLEKKRSNHFENSLPDNNWLMEFYNKYPYIFRTSEPNIQATICFNEAYTRKWFESIEEHLKRQENLIEILEEPKRIFYANEIHISRFINNSFKDSLNLNRNIEEDSAVSFLFPFSAAGDRCSPMIIFNKEENSGSDAISIPDTWSIGNNHGATIKSQSFFDYIKNVFSPFLLKSGINLPVILFVDSQRVRMTRQLSKLCDKLKIILVAINLSSKTLMQITDVEAQKVIEEVWINDFLNWEIDGNNDETCFKFCLDDMKEIYLRNTFIDCFRKAGIFPWNVGAIDFNSIENHHLQQLLQQIFSQMMNPNKIFTKQDFENIIGTQYTRKIQQLHKNNDGSVHSEEISALSNFWKIYSDDSLDLSNENTDIFNPTILTETNLY